MKRKEYYIPYVTAKGVFVLTNFLVFVKRDYPKMFQNILIAVNIREKEFVIVGENNNAKPF